MDGFILCSFSQARITKTTFRKFPPTTINVCPTPPSVHLYQNSKSFPNSSQMNHLSQYVSISSSSLSSQIFWSFMSVSSSDKDYSCNVSLTLWGFFSLFYVFLDAIAVNLLFFRALAILFIASLPKETFMDICQDPCILLGFNFSARRLRTHHM